jgi:hypothetical protein
MKFNKLALTAAISAVLAASASADQTFYLYGSTAYRKATFQALNHLYTSATLRYDVGDGVLPAIDSTTATIPLGAPTSAQIGSSNLVWVGSLSNLTGTTTIYCNWAGSVAGIGSLADSADNPSPPQYLQSPYNNVSTSLFTHKPDVAMSDCDQIQTQWDPSQDPSATELDEQFVSVLEFIWAKGNDGGTGDLVRLTNVGPWSIQAILSQSFVPASQFTGFTTDTNYELLPVGRNNDSGTRILGLVGSFYGPLNSVNQWELNNESTSTFNYNVPFTFSGNDGYASGGSVAKALAATRPASWSNTNNGTTTNQSFIIAYVAVTDALNTNGLTGGTLGKNIMTNVTSAVVPTNQWLNYNGVQWSEPAITEGAYTYFGYEHVYTVPGDTSSVSNFVSELATEQRVQAGTAFVPGTMPLSVMDIGQRPDGGVIGHN